MKSAVVIGGGFIGVEIAENLIQRGVAVTLVELAGQVLAQFDEDMAAILENELAKNGVNLMLNTSVTAVDEKGDGLELTLSTGEKISADFVVVGAGVIPDTDFLKGSGIELGLRGHIIVNEKMQTNIRDIYAVGDAIEVVDFVNGKDRNTLGRPANKQAG